LEFRRVLFRSVRVSAFAVNWADLLERSGRYPGAPAPPYVTGHDLTGVVAALGPGVAEPAVGTRVFGVIPRGGAAAEYVAAPADRPTRAPAPPAAVPPPA